MGDLQRVILDKAEATCLRVHGGVPVGVVEDDGVGAGEVHAHAAGARGQDEHKQLGVRVEALHEHLQEVVPGFECRNCCAS